jgi:putative redox protein
MGDIKTAVVKWEGEGMAFRGTLGSGFEFPLGSPAGEERGSPMEFLLAGVAGCTAVDIVSTLRKMRQEITDVTVEISGERADAPQSVYTSDPHLHCDRKRGYRRPLWNGRFRFLKRNIAPPA